MNLIIYKIKNSPNAKRILAIAAVIVLLYAVANVRAAMLESEKPDENVLQSLVSEEEREEIEAIMQDAEEGLEKLYESIDTTRESVNRLREGVEAFSPEEDFALDEPGASDKYAGASAGSTIFAYSATKKYPTIKEIMSNVDYQNLHAASFLMSSFLLKLGSGKYYSKDLREVAGDYTANHLRDFGYSINALEENAWAATEIAIASDWNSYLHGGDHFFDWDEIEEYADQVAPGIRKFLEEEPGLTYAAYNAKYESVNLTTGERTLKNGGTLPSESKEPDETIDDVLINARANNFADLKANVVEGGMAVAKKTLEAYDNGSLANLFDDPEDMEATIDTFLRAGFTREEIKLALAEDWSLFQQGGSETGANWSKFNAYYGIAEGSFKFEPAIKEAPQAVPEAAETGSNIHWNADAANGILPEDAVIDDPLLKAFKENYEGLFELAKTARPLEDYPDCLQSLVIKPGHLLNIGELNWYWPDTSVAMRWLQMELLHDRRMTQDPWKSLLLVDVENYINGSELAMFDWGTLVECMRSQEFPTSERVLKELEEYFPVQ
jgi:hypothetical protein